jgi:hypothetical protein
MSQHPYVAGDFAYPREFKLVRVVNTNTKGLRQVGHAHACRRRGQSPVSGNSAQQGLCGLAGWCRPHLIEGCGEFLPNRRPQALE